MRKSLREQLGQAPPGHGEEKISYAQTPLVLDHNFAMSEYVGTANGLQETELADLAPRLTDLDQKIRAWRAGGGPGFFALPYDLITAKEIKKSARKYKEWCRDMLVIGTGGAALGARVLQQALCHPSHNYFPVGRRQYNSRLFVLDNLDPDYLYGLLDDLELKRLLVNVISKSGVAPATIANFLVVYNLLQGRLGEDKTRESFVLTTDPEDGDLRRLAVKFGFGGFSFPKQVSGCFSILSAAALFPAAMAGIDIEGLLAGAAFMDQHLQESSVSQNAAYRLAACYFLTLTLRGNPIQVFMPYAASLVGVADWLCRLWEETLGKKLRLPGASGPTPLRAVGVADQHSLGQLLMAGPANKIVTFLEVEKFQHQLSVPAAFPEYDGLNYLNGQKLTELLHVDKKTLAFNLMQSECPNITIKLPEINAFTIGQLLYFFEVAAIALAALLDVDPADRSGKEIMNRTSLGLLQHPGYEAHREEFEKSPPLQDKYIL